MGLVLVHVSFTRARTWGLPTLILISGVHRFLCTITATLEGGEDDVMLEAAEFTVLTVWASCGLVEDSSGLGLCCGWSSCQLQHLPPMFTPRRGVES